MVREHLYLLLILGFVAILCGLLCPLEKEPEEKKGLSKMIFEPKDTSKNNEILLDLFFVLLEDERKFA